MSKLIDNYLTYEIKDLKSKKFKEFVDHEASMEKVIEIVLPKTSKILIRNLKMKIFQNYDPLNIVVL